MSKKSNITMSTRNGRVYVAKKRMTEIEMLESLPLTDEEYARRMIGARRNEAIRNRILLPRNSDHTIQDMILISKCLCHLNYANCMRSYSDEIKITYNPYSPPDFPLLDPQKAGLSLMANEFTDNPFIRMCYEMIDTLYEDD